jgi:hypothetical protein
MEEHVTGDTNILWNNTDTDDISDIILCVFSQNLCEKLPARGRKTHFQLTMALVLNEKAPGVEED